MDKNICLITGSNSGIGKEATYLMGKKGYSVIMACRSKERGEAALNELLDRDSNLDITLMILDISLKSSIINFVDQFKNRYKKLDVLIQNAAYFDITNSKKQITEEGLELVWATNYIGPSMLSYLLLEMLEQSGNGKIINISSKGLIVKPFLKVDLVDTEYNFKPYSLTNAYYQSKLATVMFTYWFSKVLEEKNITVNALRVPAVKVDITKYKDLSKFMKWAYLQKSKKALSPEDMAKVYVRLATESSFNGVTGRYFDESLKEVGSGYYSKKVGNIEDVINLTTKYIPELGEFLE